MSQLRLTISDSASDEEAADVVQPQASQPVFIQPPPPCLEDSFTFYISPGSGAQMASPVRLAAESHVTSKGVPGTTDNSHMASPLRAAAESPVTSKGVPGPMDNSHMASPVRAAAESAVTSKGVQGPTDNSRTASPVLPAAESPVKRKGVPGPTAKRTDAKRRDRQEKGCGQQDRGEKMQSAVKDSNNKAADGNPGEKLPGATTNEMDKRGGRKRVLIAALSPKSKAKEEQRRKEAHRASSIAWHKKFQSKGVCRKTTDGRGAAAPAADAEDTPGASAAVSPVKNGLAAKNRFVKAWIAASNMTAGQERVLAANQAWMESSERAALMAARTQQQA